MSGINYIQRITGSSNNLVQINTTDDTATAVASNYILNQAANIAAVNEGAWQWQFNDLIVLSASDGVSFATIVSPFDSLIPYAFTAAVVGTPVTIGDFAVFASTGGNLEDLGYLPSDSSKTRVVMASAATVSGNIAVFTDTHGTVDDSASGSILNLKYGATPVAQVDPGSCTISAAAGTTNTATVTIQLKDGGGNNITYSGPFKVYASSASNGLTLASAASTGFSVASGGLSLANGSVVTTQINGVTSATGGVVLSLLDTGKQTSYLVLVLHNGVKISAQLSAGSYG